MRLLLINPNTTQSMTDAMTTVARQIADQQAEIIPSQHRRVSLISPRVPRRRSRARACSTPLRVTKMTWTPSSSQPLVIPV